MTLRAAIEDMGLRCMARREGFVLRKSREPLGPSNAGGYAIYEVGGAAPIAGEGFDLSGDEAFVWIAESSRRGASGSGRVA